MATFHQAVEVGPRDDARLQRVIALVDTATTYAMMPAPLLTMLGISPQWTGVFDRADGSQEELPVAEIRLRIASEERTAICVFGNPDSQPVLGRHTLEAFGLAADPGNRLLVPARLFLA